MAKQQTNMPTHVVKTPFRDLKNFDQIWEVGDDVSHFDEDRLKKAVENGHVEEVAESKPA